jgi:hypothetical protein
MILFAAIYHDGDDCSWNADYVLGIFQSRPMADEAILKDLEANEDRDLLLYETKQIELDELWD